MELKDMTALVTGAGSSGGIGAQIARVLAAAGAEVVVSGRDESRGRQVVEEITGAGGVARLIVADLSDVEAVQTLADEAGDVNILVNNAANLPPMVGSADTTPAAFDLGFAINVRAPYFLTAAIGPRMAKRGDGSIINISSLAGTLAFPGMSVYGATKAALESLTRSWAAEWADSGVRANAIMLGTVTSEFVSGVLGEETMAALGQAAPLSRNASPDEIAQFVAFLASDRSSFITGATLAADGGRTIV